MYIIYTESIKEYFFGVTKKQEEEAIKIHILNYIQIEMNHFHIS